MLNKPMHASRFDGPVVAPPNRGGDASVTTFSKIDKRKRVACCSIYFISPLNTDPVRKPAEGMQFKLSLLPDEAFNLEASVHGNPATKQSDPTTISDRPDTTSWARGLPKSRASTNNREVSGNICKMRSRLDLSHSQANTDTIGRHVDTEVGRQHSR